MDKGFAAMVQVAQCATPNDAPWDAMDTLDILN